MSAGCKHCYADALTKRSGLAIWGQDGTRHITSEDYWKKPLSWAKQARRVGERYRVFPSMCDPFEDRPELIEPRERMFRLISSTPELDWLLLTKRPENMVGMLPVEHRKKPWPNVWLGASVENQATADERIPHLLRTPAVVRFLSMEPLLGPVDLDSEHADGLHALGCGDSDCKTRDVLPGCRGIDWVIVGGESGHGARPMDVEWARSIKDQCQAAGVSFFMKQLSSHGNKAYKDFGSFPDDLRVREMPAAPAKVKR